MESSFIKDHAAGGLCDYIFGVGYCAVKVGVSPRTTRLTSQKVGCLIYNENFVSYQSIYYSSMSHE